jgi:opacity protein-like surface antigen
MSGNFTSRRTRIVGAAASSALPMSTVERCRATGLTTRTFLGSRLRSPFSIRASAMTCASLAILLCASAVGSPAVAETDIYVTTSYGSIVYRAVRKMTAAIKACDYDKWAAAKKQYDLYSGSFQSRGGTSPDAPSYPIPCYPPEERADIGARIGGPRIEAASSTGFYIGGNVSGNFNTLRQTETSKATDVVTGRFLDSSNAVGGGIVTGFLFSPWNNNILVGPSASVDFLRQDTNHNFPGNVFLGQTINVIGTVNGQIGVAARPGLFVYGELGLAFANLDHRLNFSGPVTSVNQNVTGVNVGIGAAFQPPDWQIAGNPVAVFVQYNHIILPGAMFDNPGSPGFTYRNENLFDEFKIGVRVQLCRPLDRPAPNGDFSSLAVQCGGIKF